MKALSWSNLTFTFDSYLPNHAKMAAILIFNDISRKGIFFAFCFVNSCLLSIYFSKYLQFLLSTVTHCKNHVTQHVFLQDNGPWKWKFFHFPFFVFSILGNFPKKTYEKTCCFYNIFSKFSSSRTCLLSFTIWIFSSKILWLFQYNIHFFQVWRLLREKLWKDPPILWLIFKLPIIMCMLSKFCHLKIFTKKMAAVLKCQQFIIHFHNLEKQLRQNLWKDLPIFFYIYWNFHFIFTCLQNFMIANFV